MSDKGAVVLALLLGEIYPKGWARAAAAAAAIYSQLNASLRSLSAWLRTKKGNARHLVAVPVVASGLAIPVV